MIINFKKLINLPVFTESGQKLGKVCDLELATESHQIKKISGRRKFFERDPILNLSGTS